MGKKIYAGNLSFKATEDDIRALFAKFGEVESVKLIVDTATGRSKGFSFIEMTSDEDAQKAIDALNSSSFMERTITVSEARPEKPRENRGFGNRDRGFGGDRGGSRGPGGFDRGGRGPGRGRR